MVWLMLVGVIKEMVCSAAEMICFMKVIYVWVVWLETEDRSMKLLIGLRKRYRLTRITLMPGLSLVIYILLSRSGDPDRRSLNVYFRVLLQKTIRIHSSVWCNKCFTCFSDACCTKGVLELFGFEIIIYHFHYICLP